MDPGKLLEGLLDKKTLSVLRLLSQNAGKQYYLREISKTTRVPVATVYRIMNKLVGLDIIEVIQIKKFKLYQYGASKEAKFVEQLIEIRKGAVEEFIELCRPIEGIKQVILHGKSRKTRQTSLL